jgi:LAS superfamily LD-carboxypeptidase LdcB
MADTIEDGTVIPTPAAPAVAVDPVVDALKQTTVLHDINVLEAVNAATPVVTTTIPDLPTVELVGYNPNTGKPFKLIAISVAGEFFERNAGYDLIYLRQAAKKAGFNLPINSGWRSMEYQTRLYRERVNPDKTLTPIGKIKGPAAQPGFSNHQGGFAADLEVGLNYKDFNAGKRTALYNWMLKHGPDYGWTWGEAPSEPWHFTHYSKEIVGKPIDIPALALELSQAAASVKSPLKRGLDKHTALEAYDRAKAVERAKTMSTTSRDAHMDQAAAQALQSGVRTAQVASGTQQTFNLTEPPRPPLSSSDADAISYDFATGLWGGPKPSPV